MDLRTQNNFALQTPNENHDSFLNEANIEEHLTQREQEILKCIEDEMSIEETAIQLDITPNTVNFHRKNLFDKLNVHKNISAVLKGRKLGLLY